MRLKYLVEINRRVLPESTDPGFQFAYIDISAATGGTIQTPDELSRFDESPSRARRLGRPNSTIVSTVRTYLRAIARVPESAVPLVFSTGFAVLEAREGLDDRFLSYACLSEPFVENVVARSVGVSYPAISPSDLGNIEIPVPSLDEQRRIADFLDAETSRLDRLFQLRAGQIDSLEGRELSLILTSFSEPYAKKRRRPAPWEWMPNIPENWSVGPVWAYFSTELGKMLNPDRASGDHRGPYLRNANVHWYSINTEDMATMSFEPGERQRYSVFTGDLLVCEGGAGVAEASVWDGRIEPCYFQKSLHRVRQAKDVPVEWLMYWLRLSKHVGQFDAEGNLATIPHLTGEQLRSLRLPIPPDVDVRVRRLGEQIRALAVVRSALDRANLILTERRQALITAAVTGQFDVTTGRSVDLS